MKRLSVLFLFLALLGASTMRKASAEKLPRWRGFNLLEMYSKGKDGLKPAKPFVEEDFRWIKAWGFDFVRLPMDYRYWIKDNDWNRIDEEALKSIDQAVAWGQKYGIHVCINFHRAPGYCCNPPKEPRDLWTDPEAQEVCARHWATFARRYRGIPSSRLSFNLFNEPGSVSAENYAKVAGVMIKAIRAEDPARLIISDGIGGGTQPVAQLIPLGVAQSTRGYAPHYISHYKAPWAGDVEWPEPLWPKPILNAVLSGKDMGLDAPLVLKSGFNRGGILKVKVKLTGESVHFKVLVRGVALVQKKFPLKPDQAWKVLPPSDRKEIKVKIPAGTKSITLAVEGGYLVLGEVKVQPEGAPEVTLPLSGEEWDMKQQPVILDAKGNPDPKKTQYYSRQWMWDEFMAPWRALQDKGVGVHVGEFACYNQTPYPVTLAWMEDWLANWKRAGWGWAMWNFRGSMGILDSGRADAVYEDFHGHKLDRKMLKLLQKY